MTGAVLLVLLAVECYTILRIGRLLTLHVFLGMLLLGPVAIKAASVLYRFARYYTGSGPYRRKGPPALLLRLIGPIIMLLTACVFGSGVMLTVTGPSYGPPSGWLVVHRISFFAWLFFIAIHVLAYVPRLPRLLAAEARGVSVPQGETGGHAGAGLHTRRAMEVLGGRGTRLGPADRLASSRPGDRPAHRAPRGPVAVRVSRVYPILRPVLASCSLGGRGTRLGPADRRFWPAW